VGPEGEGVEDLTGGLMSAAFYLGTSLGPLLAGVGVTLIGFPWTMTALSVALLLHCFILGFVAHAGGLYHRKPVSVLTEGPSYQALPDGPRGSAVQPEP
jgi:hypothetical protein